MRNESGNITPMQELPKRAVELCGKQANRSKILPEAKTSHLHCYKYLWKECTKTETIIGAWEKLRKGKTRRPEVIEIESNFAYYVELMQKTIIATRPVEDGGDPELMFTPINHKPKYIYEHKKVREIYCPTIWEQWFHHIVIRVLARIVTKHSYNYSCGSMPNRGGVYGKRMLERAIKKRSFRYFIQGDIRHFFMKATIPVVCNVLRKLICDEWFIFLIKRIYLYYSWLVLGFYPSQWIANYLLCPFDWFVKRHKMPLYIRYVDDFIIGGNSKRKLHRLLGQIRHFLGKHFRLRLKNNRQVAKFSYYKTARGKRVGRCIDIMGFVFKSNKTIIRESIMLRATRMAKRLKKLPYIAAKQAQSMLSRYGWFKHTKTDYCWRNYIQPCISTRALKLIVSRSSKKERNRNDISLSYRMDSRTMRLAA